MKICPNCKTEYDDLENFCVKCGKRLDKEDTLKSLSDRLLKMEENLSKLARSGPAVGGGEPFVPGVEKKLQELRLPLLERINHNADAIERLSERVKEMDGVSGKNREKAGETIRKLVQEESKSIGPGLVSDLREGLQNINGRFESLSGELAELRGEMESFRKDMQALETRVAQRIYKELTKSLIR